MNTRALIIITASILVACSNSNQTLTLTIDREKYRNAYAANLARQLESINYPATVTADGDTLNVRVGAASIPDVRRAVCSQMGRQSAEGKRVQLDVTLSLFPVAGITKLKIIGDAETVEVELEKDGRCRKSP